MPLPFEAGPYRPQMGLTAVDARDWIALGPDVREQLVEKRRLLAERHAEVFAALPGTEEAGAEIADLLFDHLPSRFPTEYPRMDQLIAIAATGERFLTLHRAASQSARSSAIAPSPL